MRRHHALALVATTLPLLVVVASSSRRCIFVHGVGQLKGGPSTDKDTKGYWGGDKVKTATRHICDHYVFLHMETVSNVWNSSSLHQQVCHAAAGERGVIPTDTVIFTHSMGNLIFAATLLSGRCSLSPATNWISLSAPWGGSKAADWVARVCANEKRGIPWVLRKVANKLHYCNQTHVNNAYASMATTDPALASGLLRRVAEKHVTASLCGTSASGITSKYSLELGALSAAVDYREPNDGMVGVSSCKLRNRVYSDDYHATHFYTGRLNHADGTMRNGDGHTAAKSPLKWVAHLDLGSSVHPL